eukprot:scaffold138517_cov44-Prasinocladus_malaysianus.AAC.1
MSIHCEATKRTVCHAVNVFVDVFSIAKEIATISNHGLALQCLRLKHFFAHTQASRELVSKLNVRIPTIRPDACMSARHGDVEANKRLKDSMATELGQAKEDLHGAQQSAAECSQEASDLRRKVAELTETEVKQARTVSDLEAQLEDQKEQCTKDSGEQVAEITRQMEAARVASQAKLSSLENQAGRLSCRQGKLLISRLLLDDRRFLTAITMISLMFGVVIIISANPPTTFSTTH